MEVIIFFSEKFEKLREEKLVLFNLKKKKKKKKKLWKITQFSFKKEVFAPDVKRNDRLPLLEN